MNQRTYEHRITRLADRMANARPARHASELTDLELIGAICAEADNADESWARSPWQSPEWLEHLTGAGGVAACVISHTGLSDPIERGFAQMLFDSVRHGNPFQLESLRAGVPSRMLSAAYAAIEAHVPKHRGCPRIAQLAQVMQ